MVLCAAVALGAAPRRSVLSPGATSAAQNQCVVAIAAASDLLYAMQTLAAEFQTATGCGIRVSLGSSGNFYSQIENGAPFDLFFSADMEYPKKLEVHGFAVPGSARVYGVGQIVLWVRNDSQLNVGRGLEALRDPVVKKIAIANPRHAPYGRAAEQALKAAGVYRLVQQRFVLGENISQAMQFVESGNADAGILALSLALSPALAGKGRYAQIPEALYAPIEQAVVLLRVARNPAMARAFLDFTQTPAGVQVLAKYGFAVPRRETP